MNDVDQWQVFFESPIVVFGDYEIRYRTKYVIAQNTLSHNMGRDVQRRRKHHVDRNDG